MLAIYLLLLGRPFKLVVLEVHLLQALLLPLPLHRLRLLQLDLAEGRLLLLGLLLGGQLAGRRGLFLGQLEEGLRARVRGGGFGLRLSSGGLRLFFLHLLGHLEGFGLRLGLLLWSSLGLGFVLECMEKK